MILMQVYAHNYYIFIDPIFNCIYSCFCFFDLVVYMVLSLLLLCCIGVRFSIIYIHLNVSVCYKCQYNFTFDTFMNFVFVTTNP